MTRKEFYDYLTKANQCKVTRVDEKETALIWIKNPMNDKQVWINRPIDDKIVTRTTQLRVCQELGIEPPPSGVKAKPKRNLWK